MNHDKRRELIGAATLAMHKSTWAIKDFKRAKQRGEDTRGAIKCVLQAEQVKLDALMAIMHVPRLNWDGELWDDYRHAQRTNNRAVAALQQTDPHVRLMAMADEHIHRSAHQ